MYVPDTAGCAILVFEDVGSYDITSLPHMVLEILPLGLKSQIAHEEAPPFNIFTVGVALLHHRLPIILISLTTTT